MVIIGGGNSISQFPTLWDDLQGHDVMAVNHAYRFLHGPPKWIFSIDRKFWKINFETLQIYERSGSRLIGRDMETTKTWDPDKIFCGQRKLSGVAAISWAIKNLNPEQIFLFGYDFGQFYGRTHFYDHPKHSGLGKVSAYQDNDGNILPAVKDFEHFKEREIYIFGDSNITCFQRTDYRAFIENKAVFGANRGIGEGVV